MTADRPTATILIVDDTPANLGVIVEGLEDHGFRIVVATRGEEALRRADYVLPDLILLDVMLPDLNGFEICQQLKSQPGTREIPVIFMTSLTGVEDKVTGFSVGGVDYVTKPLQVEEVRARVQTHLSLRAMQKEMERKNAQLAVANEELEAFSYSVSHDLRAPLRAITGFTQMLLDTERAQLSPAAIERLDKVLLASKRMESLIHELLAYARTGHDAISAAPVPLDPLAQQLDCIFGARFAAINARLEVSRPLATPLGEATLLAQILSNLIDNALKYRRRDETLEVRLSATAVGEHVIVRVADNGIGIPAEHQQKVFHPFQRLHSEREYPGAGIGLAIVMKAVRAMNGDISVESVHGQGSTFSIRLPAAPAAERP